MISSEDENNTTGNQVGIPTPDGVKNVDPALLKGWKSEAFEYLREEASAKEGLKEVVETASETTGVPKALLNKWFKASFKAETKKQSEIAESFEALDEAVGDSKVLDHGEDDNDSD